MRKLLTVVVVVGLAIVLYGCLVCHEYAVGVHVEQWGQIVEVSAQLWHGAGCFQAPDRFNWHVSFGDGVEAGVEDSVSFHEGYVTDGHIRWRHLYEEPGTHLIEVWTDTAPKVAKLVVVE